MVLITMYRNNTCVRPRIAAPIDGHAIEVGKLQRVIHDPSGHAGEAGKMHREERQVDADRRDPEVNLAEPLAYMWPVHLGSQ